jgi:N-acyl-L-homoserine lactone synthetase
MIHAVTAANRAFYANQIQEMHRLRWRFFVEQRGWKGLEALQTEPGVERDELDDARAVYLMALSDTGQVEAAMRIRPADDKSIVGDLFPQLLDFDTRSGFGPKDWEITRTMRAPELEREDGKLRLKLTCAACEFALSRGIERFVCLVDTFLLPSMRALNREKHRVISLPQPYAEGEMIAVELYPDQEWLERARAIGGFAEALLFERSLAQAELEHSAAA